MVLPGAGHGSASGRVLMSGLHTSLGRGPAPLRFATYLLNLKILMLKSLRLDRKTSSPCAAPIGIPLLVGALL